MWSNLSEIFGGMGYKHKFQKSKNIFRGRVEGEKEGRTENGGFKPCLSHKLTSLTKNKDRFKDLTLEKLMSEYLQDG